MTSIRVKSEPLDPNHPRERMIRSALYLIGENGVDGTSFSQVIEHSGAPRGSIYHHFPGGKSQLVEEAIRYAGDLVTVLFAEQFEKADPLGGLDAIVSFWRGVLHANDFAAGCPVLAATLESDELPGARTAVSATFDVFQDVHIQILRRAGVPEERARSLAAVAVSAVEGAIIISRAQRSTAPLDRVLDELQVLFRGAINDVEGKQKGTAS